MAAVGRVPLLLLSLLVFTLLTYGFPQPRLSPLHRGSSPADEAQRKLLYPSVSLRDWSLQMMSDFGAAESQTEVLGEEWFSSNPDLWASNPSLWASNPSLWASNSGQEKRNIVVADDAAFREKSKLLTAMERQKWLNSYMQKLLVVNSQ